MSDESEKQDLEKPKMFDEEWEQYRQRLLRASRVMSKKIDQELVDILTKAGFVGVTVGEYIQTTVSLDHTWPAKDTHPVPPVLTS